MPDTRPIMKDLRVHHDQAAFAARLDACLAREEALNNVTREYELKQAEEKGELFKDYGQYKADVLERVSKATTKPHQTWEEKGDEWKAQVEAEKKEEEKQQRLLAKKANKWLESLEAEFEGGEE